MENNIHIHIENRITSLKDAWQILDAQAIVQINNGNLKYIEYSFYQTYTWNSFIHNTYKHSKKQIEYIVASVDNVIKVILPLLVNKSKKNIKILTGNIAGIINIVCPYRDNAAKKAVLSVIKLMKAKYSEGWNIVLKDIPRCSIFMESLIEEGFHSNERMSYHIPLSTFANYEEYKSSLGKNIYKNIRKAYNHLSTDNIQMKLDIYNKSTPPSLQQIIKLWKLYYTRMLSWHKKEKNISNSFGIWFKALSNSFWGRQTKSMKQLDESEVYVITLNNKIAAFMHIYNHKGHVLMPKLAIDASFSRYSPGILLLLESLKLMKDKGVKDFDMCRGDERYKKEMGGLMEALCYITFDA